MKKYDFQPDYRNIVRAARNERPARAPLYEHIICPEMMCSITGSAALYGMNSGDKSERLRGFAAYWDFWRLMGYDTASYECLFTDILPGSGALYHHREGAIKTRADFEAYPWDALPDMFFKAFEPRFEALAETCPEDMRAVGGVGNGVFECVEDITGYMDLCYLSQDDPELYEDLFAAMGAALIETWRRFLSDYASPFCVARFGDDLGFHSSTLLSADDVRAHILPVYSHITELAHASGRPFLLHSCGNLFGIFDDIIQVANIDAKHSNEDSIARFSVWVERYGERIGNFGGIDTDVLCRKTPEEIRAYVFDCLNNTRGRGGIAFGSGNSIPEYVPRAGYLAMVEAARDWRGDTLKA